jgi:hypothetical protein
MCCGHKRMALKSASSRTPTPSMMQGEGNPRASSTVQAATWNGPYYSSPSATQGTNNSRPTPGTDQPGPRWTGPAHGSVTLRYLESSPILVQGPATGRHYHFSGAHPLQSVDACDAEPLLRTQFFRRSS